MKRYVWIVFYTLWFSNVWAYVSPSARKHADFIDVFLSSIILSIVMYLIYFIFQRILNFLAHAFNPQLWKESKKIIKTTKQNKNAKERKA